MPTTTHTVDAVIATAQAIEGASFDFDGFYFPTLKIQRDQLQAATDILAKDGFVVRAEQEVGPAEGFNGDVKDVDTGRRIAYIFRTRY